MEEDLLGTFSRTRKPYLNGSGSSAWGDLHVNLAVRRTEIIGTIASSDFGAEAHFFAEPYNRSNHMMQSKE
jgi:hypothetical protein